MERSFVFIDGGVATLIAAIVALGVGLTGVFWNRRTALDAQRVAERARSLGKASELVALRGGALQDMVFNLTIARPDRDPDPVSGYSSRSQYAPRRREVRSDSPSELAQLESLIAAHGTDLIDRCYDVWKRSCEEVDARYLEAEANYFEGATEAQPKDFEPERGNEVRARVALNRAIRNVLHADRKRTSDRKL